MNRTLSALALVLSLAGCDALVLPFYSELDNPYDPFVAADAPGSGSLEWAFGVPPQSAASSHLAELKTPELQLDEPVRWLSVKLMAPESWFTQGRGGWTARLSVTKADNLVELGPAVALQDWPLNEGWQSLGFVLPSPAQVRQVALRLERAGPHLSQSVKVLVDDLRVETASRRVLFTLPSGARQIRDWSWSNSGLSTGTLNWISRNSEQDAVPPSHTLFSPIGRDQTVFVDLRRPLPAQQDYDFVQLSWTVNGQLRGMLLPGFEPFAWLEGLPNGQTVTIRHQAFDWSGNGGAINEISVTPTQMAPQTGVKVHTREYTHLFWWDSIPVGSAGTPLDWPGGALPAADAEGWRTWEWPEAKAVKFIFNNGVGEAQTADLARPAGEWWFDNGQWSSAKPAGPGPTQVTLSFDPNGANGGEVPQAVTVNSGSVVTIPGNTNNLQKPGFTFVGWNTVFDDSGTEYLEGDSLTLNSDLTLYAVWRAADNVTLSYDPNGAEDGTTPSPSVSAPGDLVTLAENSGSSALTRPGFAFVGWNTASDGSGTRYLAGSGTFTITADTTVYAEWAVDAELVNVPGGRYQRDEFALNVSQVSPFALSRYEVTRAQFAAVMGFDPSDTTKSSGINDPVQKVNWYHALAFLNKLSLLHGYTPVYSVNGVTDWASLSEAQIPTAVSPDWDAATADWQADGYRLPTDMEYMWAAMGAPSDGQNGGTNTTGYLKAFAGDNGSNTLGQYVWYQDNAPGTSSPVGQKLPNELGLYDLSGNVYELVWDWYGDLPAGELINYQGPALGTRRSSRSGPWNLGASLSAVGYREPTEQWSQYYNNGFRIARGVPASDDWTLLWTDDFEDGTINGSYIRINETMMTEGNGYLELRQEQTDNGPAARLRMTDLLLLGVVPSQLKFSVDVWVNSSVHAKSNEIGFYDNTNPLAGGLYATLVFGDFTVSGSNNQWIHFRPTYVNVGQNAVSFSTTPQPDQWILGNVIEMNLSSGAVAFVNDNGVTGATTLIDPTFDREQLYFNISPSGFSTGHVMRVDNLRIYYKP